MFATTSKGGGATCECVWFEATPVRNYINKYAFNNSNSLGKALLGSFLSDNGFGLRAFAQILYPDNQSGLFRKLGRCWFS